MNKFRLMVALVTVLAMGYPINNMAMGKDDKNPCKRALFQEDKVKEPAYKRQRTEESASAPSNIRINRFSSLLSFDEQAFINEVPDEAAEKFGQPLNDSSLAIGQLVLIKEAENRWKYARVNEIINKDGNYVVQCASIDKKMQKSFDLSNPVNYDNIKILKKLYQCLWQPGVPTSWFELSIDQLLALECLPQVPALQGFFVPIESKVVVIGDLHGDVKALQHHLDVLFNKGFFDADLNLQQNHYIVFTGDYGDRGQFGAEVYYILAQLKSTNPHQIFLLRGNHEDEWMAKQPSYGGLYAEIINKYGQEVWSKIAQLFNRLPYVLLVGLQTPGTTYYNFVQFCHGGIDYNFGLKNYIIGIINHANTLKTYHLSGVDLISITQYDFVGDDTHVMYKNNETGEKVTALSPMKGKTVNSMREGGRASTTSLLRKYFDKKSRMIDWNQTPQFELSCLIRGHEHHVPGGAARLLDTETQSWKGLDPSNTYQVEKTAYTFISCPNSMPGSVFNYTHGFLFAAPNGRWYLTPYIYRVPIDYSDIASNIPMASSSSSSSSSSSNLPRGMGVQSATETVLGHGAIASRPRPSILQFSRNKKN